MHYLQYTSECIKIRKTKNKQYKKINWCTDCNYTLYSQLTATLEGKMTPWSAIRFQQHFVFCEQQTMHSLELESRKMFLKVEDV